MKANMVGILLLFQENSTLRYGQIKKKLSMEDHTLSRNLTKLTKNGILRKEEGYKGYTSTLKYNSLLKNAQKLEFLANIKTLLKEPPMSKKEEDEMFKSINDGKLPPENWELVEPVNLKDEERLWREYQKEISEILKHEPSFNRNLLFSWAKYSRKIKKEKFYKDRSYGPRRTSDGAILKK